MKYMLLVYLDEQCMTEAERADCYVQSARLAQEIHARGKYLDASPLHPVSTATSIRVREGKRMVTDGPFAETREQLGGFYLINAKDLDDAIALRGESLRPVSALLKSGQSWKFRGFQRPINPIHQNGGDI